MLDRLNRAAVSEGQGRKRPKFNKARFAKAPRDEDGVEDAATVHVDVGGVTVDMAPEILVTDLDASEPVEVGVAGADQAQAAASSPEQTDVPPVPQDPQQQ